MGPARLSWVEFDAFQRLSGLRLAPWEIELLEDLDNLALKDRSKDGDD